MSVPNEAIIETGDRRVVYVKDASGSYVPGEIQIGLQGDFFTEVAGGLEGGRAGGDLRQLLIDADFKLKGS